MFTTTLHSQRQAEELIMATSMGNVYISQLIQIIITSHTQCIHQR